MKPMTSMILLFAVALGDPASGDDEKRGQSRPRDDLHRITLSDGAWLVIETPFPSDEQRKERLPVNVRLYPRDVHYVKQTDKSIWVANHVTSMDYVPGNERYYALAKETKDRIFIFFTWNAQHCTVDRKSGRILRKDQGDDSLKVFDSLVPLKLLIWQRAVDRPAQRTNNSDIIGPG
jgi:hypothetical protein